MITPIFSEKSMKEATLHRYTFVVSRNLSKYQIKSLVEELFNVHVVSVSTMNYKGGVRKTLRGKTVHSAPYKKTVVFLRKDETISLWEAPKKENKKVTKKTKDIKKDNK